MAFGGRDAESSERYRYCVLGTEMNDFINYGRQAIDDDDISAVVQALQSDFLTQGPRVVDFEQAICEYTGAKFCVALSNATAGLQLAVAALELEPEAEGITSPITFVASANCMVYNHVKPVFADIDPESINIGPNKAAEACTDTTRVIIPVHFAGRPCQMKEIAQLAKDRNLYVIEDAAHAIGSSYPDGSKVGNCRYSDMTVFSFHPVKTVTTGEGGAVTTNSERLYRKLLMLRSHGITKDPSLIADNPGPWYYEMQELGYNYRLTDFQAALGISQLKKIEGFKQRRNDIIRSYNEAFTDIGVIQIPPQDDSDSCFHLYVVRIDYSTIGTTRTEVMQNLREKGIGTQVHYIPVHTQPYYRKSFGYTEGDYPLAEKYYEQALSLPLYPAMTDSDTERVINAVEGLL